MRFAIELGALAQARYNPVEVISRDAARYADAALAIGEKYYALNALSPAPSTIPAEVPLTVLMDRWETPQGREARMQWYSRVIAIRKRTVGRSVVSGPIDPSTYSDEDYAGIVIVELQRTLVWIDPAALIQTAPVALQLMAWTRADWRDIPRAFVCDVMLSMNGYFGFPEETEEPELPDGTDEGPADRRAEEDKGKIPDWLLPVGVAALAGVLLARALKGG